MSHTLAHTYYHIVWSTKERRPWLLPNIQKRLYPYIKAVVTNKKATPIAVGGIHDHVHLLIHVPPTCLISGLMQGLKISSSRFVNQINGFLSSFAWQRGYSIFCVQEDAIPIVANYINTQYEHHEVHSYQDEIDLLMKCNGVPRQEFKK